jgi:ribonuclease HI
MVVGIKICTTIKSVTQKERTQGVCSGETQIGEILSNHSITHVICLQMYNMSLYIASGDHNKCVIKDIVDNIHDGVAGVGGVITDPRETTETSFTQGLGVLSNNQAEAYALWQGLKIAKDSCARSLVVLGDSKTIINHMIFNSVPVDNPLASIIAQSKQEATNFSEISYYHVMRENNRDTNRWPNEASTLKEGVLMVNG